MKPYTKGPSAARLPKIADPAAELRQIQAELHQVALRFGLVSLEVRDSLRARKLARLARCADQAATPLARIARDLEEVNL
jgi:hypothetical protein